MVQKKNISSEKIVEVYMDSILTGEKMSTVYAFAKKYDFDESNFYEHFSGFEMLEKEIFRIFCLKTIELLHKNEEYGKYDSKSKLLSFYYTFFELLTANRSFVYTKFKVNKNKLDSLKLLSKLRVAFIDYINEEVYHETFDFKNEKINKIQEKGIAESSWLHLIFTIQFWLEDESKNFEKTDLFIEKSVKASFDLSNTTPLQSVFDFAKFLWKEKTPTL